MADCGCAHRDTPCGRDRSPWAVLNWPLVLLVRVYRGTLGQVLGGRCRFYPSCSSYALEALRTHAPIRAIWLIVYRVGRCHPLGGHGVDPVPGWRGREDGMVSGLGSGEPPGAGR